MVNRADEGAAIFATHGVADALTTIAAARAVGIDGEANPLIRELLTHGEPLTAAVMLGVVAVASAAWMVATEIAHSPRSVGYAVASVGALVALGNVVVALS